MGYKNFFGPLTPIPQKNFGFSPPHNNTHLKVWIFRENPVPIPKCYGALLPTMGAALHATVGFMAEALKIFFGFLLTFSRQLGKISCNWMKSL